MSWSKFEQNVADVFKLFGYTVETNTKISAAQTDIFATSTNPFKPSILIECKYHEKDTKKVSIDQVENFNSRVRLLRSDGLIDQGYLVTNTDFTPSAKESLGLSKNFVFLARYRDLLHKLIDVEFYLKNYCQQFESNSKNSAQVDLYLADIRKVPEIRFDYSYKSTETKTQPSWQEREKSLIHNQKWPLELQSSTTYFKDFLEGIDQLLVVFGDFGSGKTTSMQGLMHQLAQNKLNHLDDPSIPIPLLFNLRDYNKGDDFDTLLSLFFSQHLGYSNLNVSIFKRLNEAGMFVLLFDGFDEMSKLVSSIERRYTFIEIAKQVNIANKVILTTRPGYFVETKEFVTLVDQYINTSSKMTYTFNKHKIPVTIRVACLQLMGDDQVVEFTQQTRQSDKQFEDFMKIPKIRDLARRPVLAKMIAETFDKLRVNNEEIGLSKLYEIYTSNWIRLEQDKGRFRILIDPESKMKFLNSLAVQMYLGDSSKIHYTHINQQIKEYFKITDANGIDHFSHDIRTCSFISRDDDGYYSFIHTSFLEYFVAKDFSLFNDSPNVTGYPSGISSEVMELIDDRNAPQGYFKIQAVIKGIKLLKNEVVRLRKYEHASNLRELEHEIVSAIGKQWPKYLSPEIGEFEEQINALKSVMNID